MRKQRKRYLGGFLAGLSCLFLLCGCHGSMGQSEFTVPESFDESVRHEITFWAKNDTNKTQTEIYEKAIRDFEALYPNVKVNLRLYTDYGRIYNDVITNISTGTTPNVCITYPDHIATYLTGNNCVVPLDGLMSDERFGLAGSEVRFDAPAKEEMIPQFLTECAFGEHYYAVPFMRSTEACYINKTYVEKLGYEVPEELTWDFIWEVSEAATAQDAEGNYLVNGQKVLIPFIYKSTDNMMIQLLKQAGAGYSDADGNVLIFNDNTKDFLYTVAEHAETGAFSTFKIVGYPANFLNAGQCIFAIDSTAGATWMGSEAPLCDISEDKLVQFETEVRRLPQLDPANPQMISQGPSVCIFNKQNSQEVLASWLFVQYLLTNDVQIAYAQTEGYVPVTEKAQTAGEYLDYLARGGEDNELYYDIKIRASELLLSEVEHTFVTPVFNGSASLRNAAGQMIEEVTKAVRRKKDVNETFVEALFEDMTSLYRLNQRTGVGAGKKELGALPGTAVALIVVLVSAWIGMGLYVGISYLKKKRKSKVSH
ncbi:MAG: carbohydrate ABC transporter substrate-binding protein [Lachnospiraceae bacterium]|nr:carbohydrate ABC transporter substrate-binding protein [Lachnospiraceae bacterium]